MAMAVVITAVVEIGPSIFKSALSLKNAKNRSRFDIARKAVQGAEVVA